VDEVPSRSAPRRAKRGRLSRSAEFERVYRQGRSHGSRHFVLHAFPREAREGEGPRLGVSVSRKVGGAVDRNRVKRLLREAFRAEAERLPPDLDVVIVARPDVLELVEREGLPGVQAAIAELVARVAGDRG
jgi:ribonuclease P protein component